MDYYYFCDCVLKQTPEYYEDEHGNKIIGKYEGLKFVFSGFRSVIEIGDNVQFENTSIYVHSESKIYIGNNTQFLESQHYTCHSSKTEMKCGCNIVRLDMMVGEHSKVILDEEVKICCNDGNRTKWYVGKNAELKVGNQGIFSGQAGRCDVEENALLIIGKEFSISGNYRIIANSDTSILIGDDCMFSYDISIRSNDGHSIFDITTKENINSSCHINRGRKVIIGNHVWVGERVEILYNTQIGDGSIIGAMSLVKSKLPNNCIAAGIPARVIRKNVAWCRQYGAADILECGQEYIHYTEE